MCVAWKKKIFRQIFVNLIFSRLFFGSSITLRSSRMLDEIFDNFSLTLRLSEVVQIVVSLQNFHFFSSTLMSRFMMDGLDREIYAARRLTNRPTLWAPRAFSCPQPSSSILVDRASAHNRIVERCLGKKNLLCSSPLPFWLNCVFQTTAGWLCESKENYSPFSNLCANHRYVLINCIQVNIVWIFFWVFVFFFESDFSLLWLLSSKVYEAKCNLNFFLRCFENCERDLREISIHSNETNDDISEAWTCRCFEYFIFSCIFIVALWFSC